MMMSIEPARIILSTLSSHYSKFERAFVRFKWDLEYNAVRGLFNTDLYISLRNIYSPYLIRFQNYAKCLQEDFPYMSDFQYEKYKSILKEFDRVYLSISKEVSIIIEYSDSPEMIRHLLYCK